MSLKHTQPLPLKGSSALSSRAHLVVSHVVCMTAYSNRLSKILNKTLRKIFKETLKADCRHLNTEDNGKGYVFLPGDFAKSVMLLCNVSSLTLPPVILFKCLLALMLCALNVLYNWL